MAALLPWCGMTAHAYKPGTDETGFVKVCAVCGQLPGQCADPPTPASGGRHRALQGDQSDPLPAEPLSELGYARRLIKVYGDRIRYVAAWRRWLVWDGAQW